MARKSIRNRERILPQLITLDDYVLITRGGGRSVTSTTCTPYTGLNVTLTSATEEHSSFVASLTTTRARKFRPQPETLIPATTYYMGSSLN